MGYFRPVILVLVGDMHYRWRDLTQSCLVTSELIGDYFPLPFWIRDPDFQLEAHLPRVKLAAPGGMQALMELVAEIWSQVLDRRRPLWEMTFVEDLDKIPGISKGSYALITRVLVVLADRLAQPEVEWRPFKPSIWIRPSFKLAALAQ